MSRSCTLLCIPSWLSHHSESFNNCRATECWGLAVLHLPPEMVFSLAEVSLPTKVQTCIPSHFSCVQFFATLWTVAHQAPLSIGFSRQEYWSGLPRLSLGDLPNPGIELASLMSPALAGGFFATSTIWKAPGWPGSLHNYCTRNELII